MSGNLPGTTAVIEEARPKRRTMMFTRDARDTTGPKHLGDLFSLTIRNRPRRPAAACYLYKYRSPSRAGLRIQVPLIPARAEWQ